MDTDSRKYLSLEEIQQEELRLLNHYADFCEKHGLSYSLDAGTLIGAIRNQGIIPWDDDIDVCMPRPDCDQLIELKTEFETDDIALSGFYGMPLNISSQLRVISKRVYVGNENIYDHGDNNLWVDIFPIEGNPDDEATGIKACKRASFYRRLMAAGSMKTNVIDNKLLAAVIAIFRPILVSKKLRYYCAKKIRSIGSNTPYGTTNTVGAFCHVSTGEDRMPLKDFDEKLLIEFEGRLHPIMSCHDEHLRKWYGDYLTPPPPEDRFPIHRMKAWWADGFGPESSTN